MHMLPHHIKSNFLPQERLRNAAKARLIRWVKPKAKRLDREAPEIVKTEWAKGNKAAVADLFVKMNFDEDRFNLVYILMH